MSKKTLHGGAAAKRNAPSMKPRYSEAENELIFETWWNSSRRKELPHQIGREMSALRSQFCRLLKEKGLSNQEYYRMMQTKHQDELMVKTEKRFRQPNETDRCILETFAKHQALGNSRAEACEELQRKLGDEYSTAALKLRFYRLIKNLGYNDAKLLELGKQVVSGKSHPMLEPERNIPEHPAAPSVISEKGGDGAFFAQLSDLPGALQRIEDRIQTMEEKQRYQLDLRGFIEHMLAVERDLKREDKLIEEIQKLMDENESLAGMMEHERERLRKREEELAAVYRMLETTLAEFLHLESVSKLASLGDFMQRLEITVDQFGHVLKSKRVVS